MTRYKSELMHHGVKDQEWYVKHGPPYPLKEGAFEGKPKSVNKQKRARVEANEDDRDPKKKKKKKEEDKDLKKTSSTATDGDTEKDESEKPGGGLKYRTDNPEKEIQKLKDLFADGRIKDWGYDPKTGEFDVRGIDKRTYTRLRKENGIESKKKTSSADSNEDSVKDRQAPDSGSSREAREAKKAFKLQSDQELVAQKLQAKQEQKKLKLEAKLEKQKAKAVEAQAKADREAAERAAKAEKEAAERAAKAAQERAERDKKFMKGQKSTDDLNILTNDELEKRTARLNLEKNYLSAMESARPTNEVVKPLLKDLGKKTVTSFATAATVALGEKVFENLFDGKKTKKISFTDYFK